MTTYSFQVKPIEKINIWETLRNQIERNTRKRYNWKLILGDSLTKTILRLKMSGATPTESYDELINSHYLKLIKENYRETYIDMCEKIKISICARYAENETALKLFNKEFKDKSVINQDKTS